MSKNERGSESEAGKSKIERTEFLLPHRITLR